MNELTLGRDLLDDIDWSRLAVGTGGTALGGGRIDQRTLEGAQSRHLMDSVRLNRRLRSFGCRMQNAFGSWMLGKAEP